MSIPKPDIYLQDIDTLSVDLLPVRKRKMVMKAWLKELISPAQWLNDLLFKDYADGHLYGAYSAFTVYQPGQRITFIDGANYEFINENAAFLAGFAPDTYPTYWTKLQSNFLGARERSMYNFQKLMLEVVLNKQFQVALYSAKEWEVKWIANVPIAQSAPPFTQIYIKQTTNVQTNFWLSRGNGINAYLSRSSTASILFLARINSSYSIIQYSIYVPTALYNYIASIQAPGVTSPGDPAPDAGGAAIRAIVDQYAQAGSIYQFILY